MKGTAIVDNVCDEVYGEVEQRREDEDDGERKEDVYERKDAFVGR